MAGITFIIIVIIVIFLLISISFRLVFSCCCCCVIQEEDDEAEEAAAEPMEIDMLNRLERGVAVTQRDDADYAASASERLVVVTVATSNQGSDGDGGGGGGHTTVIAHYDVIYTVASSVAAVSAAPVRSDELQSSVGRMDRLWSFMTYYTILYSIQYHALAIIDIGRELYALATVPSYM